MGRLKLMLTILTPLVITSESHLIWKESDQLQPVQGLYIKPSDDGSTGDLYVAATEDNGIKSQWLVDQSINILPTTQSPTPVEEFPAEQRVVTNPAIKYAYALPLPRSKALSYPYAISALTGSYTSPYGSFQNLQKYWYPRMSSIASAVDTFNEDNIKKESNTSSFQAAQLLPNAFPFPFMVIDPTSWSKGQKDEEESATANSAESASIETS